MPSIHSAPPSTALFLEVARRTIGQFVRVQLATTVPLPIDPREADAIELSRGMRRITTESRDEGMKRQTARPHPIG
jgi:hypothetical protein